MKSFCKLLFVLLISSMMASCNNDSSNKSSSSNKIDSTTTEKFQLVAINGQFPPAGAVYEYDDKKSEWCNRPTAADLTAYATQNKIEDPEKIPDLSDYFGEKTTKLLNSCYITISTKGNLVNFMLYYNGNSVYEYSVNNAGIPNNGSKEVRVDKINNFDLSPDPDPGSMILSDGKNYVITIGKEPTISFSNESGNYSLAFKKIMPDKNN